jgi:hypothetical protein
VHQVAEELVSVRVIAHILQQASSVRISVRLPQLVGGGVRIALKDHRPDLIQPEKINDLLVGKNRVAR